MATKQKGKPSKISFKGDDLLDSLFDDKKPKGRMKETRGGPYSSATDDILGMLAEEEKMDDEDTEDSDVSAADPRDTLENMMDMNDMDEDIFSSKKKLKSLPAQKKPFGNERPKKDCADFHGDVKPEEADEHTTAGKKPSATSSAARNHKKFTFSESDGDDEGFDQRHHTEDLDDPLANILDELLPDESKPKSKSNIQRAKPGASVPPPSAPPVMKIETPKTAKSRGDLVFDDDDGDDLIDGFDDIKNNSKKKEVSLWSSEKSEPPQRARTRLDDILESLTAPRLSEQPPAVQRKDSPQSQEKQHAAGMKELPLEDDLTFGTYQPTMVSTPGGRRSRRHSVRFSTEDVGSSTPEKKPKPTTPTSSRHHSSADWLGLKTNDDLSFLEDETEEIKTLAATPEAPSSPPLERRPSLTGNQVTFAAAADGPNPTDDITKQAKPEVSEGQRVEQVEDDWLAAALSKKKALSGSTSEAKTLKQEKALEVNVEPVVSKQVTSQSVIGREDALMSCRETSTYLPGQLRPPTNSSPVRGRTLTQDCPPVAGPPPVSAANPSYSQPQNHSLTSSKGSRVPKGSSQPLDQTVLRQNLLNPLSAVLPDSVSTPQMQNTPTPAQQLTFSADSLQQLLLQQQMLQSQLLHPGAAMSVGVMQAFKEKELQSGEHQALQARIIQLEGQVKTLQLELEQSQILGENLHQRHKQDMELLENAHKARVKLLEESAAQRDTQARLEYEDLMERLATVTRSAEQERSELQAQYKRKLALAQEDRDREVERLRDLQRKSIIEMKKDHEDQIQRLKKLKDEEIDAVTSATSQTRSLAVVIEQMEQFSSQLGVLSSRVESTHEHTAQGLEQGARHRDQQLQMMQNRLGQQQKAMAEERAYLKEIISRMDVQLNEQKRQIEKERWKVTAEQAKAESTQRSLEEEQRALSMQINMEKEELERAKSSLLKEQKSVMQQCAEERRKLAAEWSHFHTKEKQRHERAEQEVSNLLERKEGSIISLAQEQADLKLRTAELKLKDVAVAREREALQRLREELDSEKERISSSALKLKTRAEEVEAFSKLAAEKHEEGEKALQEANRVEAEHEARLANIHMQTERLRQQEQRMLKKRMHLNHLGKETESQRQEPLVIPLPQMTSTILPGTGSTLQSPELILPMSSSTFANAMPLQASLPLWKYTGVKECHYLEEELNFLENLKKKSYKSTFQDQLTDRC